MASLMKVTKRSVNKPAKKSPKKSDTEAEFEYFSYLPPEIQSKIFTEALCKPHVHFMKAASVEEMKTPDTWRVKFNKLKAPDPSGFQIFNTISHVSQNAARAVRLATDEKGRMPFTKRTQSNGNMDNSTDVVCVEFGMGKNNWRHYNWARQTQVLFPARFDRDTPATDNLGIRRVAIVFNQGTARPNKQTPNLTAVFRCLGLDHARGGSVCKLCPTEVMGFLDIFPDLEAFYLIIRTDGQHTDKAAKDAVRSYRYHYYKKTKQERQALRLEEFHDRRHSYLEIRTDTAKAIKPRRRSNSWINPSLEGRIGLAFALVKDLRTAFVQPEPQSIWPNAPRRFSMDLEKRQKVKITALLQTERD
ncbi:hypothetical protein QBC37DRAFT_369955 [Rhypophila decipiens]|uniref:Uncharacterized protein n=1 Tax=Rhypophila decipiens TaxID=261697 RepID=A0AAN6YF96_9PEZI|nr:hypothetical protein QBC37DRAFT_369955 [Rhypophila decipiens]